MRVVMCLCFYYSLDPMKCRFFLVLRLVFVAPAFSFGIYIWYSYFVCLVFLRGVFVILVYFSSLSKYIYLRKPFWGVCFVLSLMVGWRGGVGYDFGVGIPVYFSSDYFFLFFYLVVILIFFINFVSYYLSIEVAIRKM